MHHWGGAADLAQAIREAGMDQRMLRLQRERYVARFDYWVSRVEAA
jgi:hypothetical protein